MCELNVSGDAVSQLDLMRSARIITLIVPVVRAVGKYSTKKAYMYFVPVVLQSAGGRGLYSQQPLQIGPGLGLSRR
jgi:hypothetical protein